MGLKVESRGQGSSCLIGSLCAGIPVHTGARGRPQYVGIERGLLGEVRDRRNSHSAHIIAHPQAPWHSINKQNVIAL